MECNIATLVVFSPLPYEKQLLFRRLRRSELGRLPLAFLDHDLLAYGRVSRALRTQRHDIW